MKTSRTLNELYFILWKEIKNKVSVDSIRCEIRSLHFDYYKISYLEFHNLSNHYTSQIPNDNRHSEFFNYEKPPIYNYYNWDYDNYNNTENRKGFIKKMLQITKS